MLKTTTWYEEDEDDGSIWAYNDVFNGISCSGDSYSHARYQMRHWIKTMYQLHHSN